VGRRQCRCTPGARRRGVQKLQGAGLLKILDGCGIEHVSPRPQILEARPTVASHREVECLWPARRGRVGLIARVRPDVETPLPLTQHTAVSS
jgi:hypothetical protein